MQEECSGEYMTGGLLVPILKLGQKLYKDTCLEKDLELCRIHGVDVFFHPSMLDYYQHPIQTITVSDITSRRLLSNLNTFVLGSFINYAFDLTIKNWNNICPDITILERLITSGSSNPFRLILWISSFSASGLSLYMVELIGCGFNSLTFI